MKYNRLQCSNDHAYYDKVQNVHVKNNNIIIYTAHTCTDTRESMSVILRVVLGIITGWEFLNWLRVATARPSLFSSRSSLLSALGCLGAREEAVTAHDKEEHAC